MSIESIYPRIATSYPAWLPAPDDDVVGYLPGIADLLKQREEAFTRWLDHITNHGDLLSPGWQAIAERKDADAARKAVAAGKDPMAGANAVTLAAGQRAKALGAADALAAAVRAVDSEILAALRPAAADAEATIDADLEAAQEAYEEAHAEAMRARQRFTRLAWLRLWVDAIQQGRGWPDADFSSSSAIGGSIYERGIEETRVVRDKLADAMNREERIAVDVDGTTKHLPASLAEELIAAGAAKRM